MRVDESGMVFNIENSDNLYHIEKSKLYKKLSDAVKIAEFLYVDKDKNCTIIEAKSSSPNQKINTERFNEYIDEVKAKFINAYTIYIANRLGRHTKEDFNEMSKPFQTLKIESQNFSFILIIKDHKKEWLQSVSDSLKKNIKVFLKSWNIKDSQIKVLNEELARESGWIE